MQVMPGTNRDPGFGVRPAADNSDAERARVGRDYLGKMTQRYGGDPAKAWAAYNAGPGRVDALVKQYGGDWLAHAPKETRDYVAVNVAALGGQGQTFAPRRDDIASIYSAIDAQPWDYDRKKFAREAVDRRVARDDYLLARSQKDAADQAYSIVNGLGDRFTSISQLPASVRRGLSPEAAHGFMATAQQNAAPKAVPANGDSVIKLRQLAALDPEAFGKTDLRQYRALMTPSEYESLSVDQAKMQAKPEEQTTYGRIWGAAKFYGMQVGVDMSAKGKGETDEAFKARMADGNKLFDTMRNYLNTVTGGKRAATDQEIKAAADNALIERRQANGTLGPRFRDASLGTNTIAVPMSQRPALLAAARRAGLPTDDQTIARLYARSQGGR